MRSSIFAVVVFATFAGCTCGGVAPPTGFSQVLTTTATTDGIMPSLVLDRDQHPMLVYLRQDSASPESWSVLFTRWDGTAGQAGAWTTPVVVASDLGAVDTNQTQQQVWLARDAQSGRLGVAFTRFEQFCGPANGNKETTIHVAFSSDMGRTWSTSERVSEARYTRNDPVNGVEVCNTSSPRIAMADGVVHVAWGADAGEVETETNFFRGYYYASSTAGGAWARQLLPHAGDDAREGRDILSLALDETGAPGVAYMMRAISLHATPNMTVAVFARPGGAAVRAGDSNSIQNDAPQLSLAFDGTKPRIASHLARANDAGRNANWVYASADGVSFTTAPVPDDAEDQGAAYMDLEFSGGRGVLLYEFGSSRTAGACGGPKRATSPDGTTWTTCGLDTETHQFLGEYVTAELTSSGKIVAAFFEDQPDRASPTRFAPGIVLYVEP